MANLHAVIDRAYRSVQVRLRSRWKRCLIERHHHRGNLIQAHRADEVDYAAVAAEHGPGGLKRGVAYFTSRDEVRCEIVDSLNVLLHCGRPLARANGFHNFRW